MAIRKTYCFDFCDPACPYYYNCHDLPIIYLSQHQPTPPPPYLDGGLSYVSPSLLIAGFFLIGVFSILIGYCVIIRKHCFHYRRRWRDYQSPPPPGIENMDEDRMDNPILLITTIGLHPSIMNATTVYKYQKGDGMIEGSECSVCLSDFQEGEMLRLLSTCNHAFHVRCIDTWLMSHTNCPLCRGNIMSPLTVEKNHSSRAQVEPVEHPGEDFDVTNDARMGDTRGNAGLDENLSRDEDLGNHQQTRRLQEESIGEIVSKEHRSPLNKQQEEIAPVGIEPNRSFYMHSLHSSSSCFSPSTSEHKIYVNDPKSPESTNYRKLNAGGNSLLKRGSSADMSSARKYAVHIARSQSCDPGVLLVHYE